MKTLHRIGLGAMIALLFAGLSAAGPKAKPQLVLRATYDTGLGANGAEVISVRHTDGIAALTNVAGSVDVLDLSDPLQPRLLRRVPIDTTAGSPNSVAIHPQHDYFLVVTGTAGVTGAVAAHRLSDGALLASATVGIQPDSIAIAPNGQYAVVANEAEGTGVGLSGGPGSLSIVDLKGGHSVMDGQLVVTNVALPSIANIPGVSSGRRDDIARLPIDNTPETIEPEQVFFSANSRFAYVTLQENNAVVRLDVRAAAIEVVGLGQTTHLADLTVDGSYHSVETLTAFREPDGIVLDQTGRFFATADEGDTRDGAGNSGPRGGRTVSVFDARSGALIADTGSQLDDAAAAAGIYPDSRSNRGGSEPEGLDLTEHRGTTLVAVTLERANAVALVDATNPARPAVIDIDPVGIGPEAVKFFRRGSRLFVASANEVSGTVSILEVVANE
jgi:DNA-binding beta-propeller fold protein YncE